VLSGGSTPGPLYDVLREHGIGWDKVSVTLSDERWTDPAAERSNEYLARRHFLNGNAAAARFVPLMTGAGTPRCADAGERRDRRDAQAVRRGVAGHGHRRA
jgi:6-phosphogluconolactonase